MISTYVYINAPWNLLGYLESNQISISGNGTKVREIGGQTKHYEATNFIAFFTILWQATRSCFAEDCVSLTWRHHIYIYYPFHNFVRSSVLSTRKLFCGSSSSYLIGVDTALHDNVIKWKPFRVTGHLWGESTGHQWIPLTNASDAELWNFFWSAPEQKVEQKIETLVIWDAITLIMTSLQCCLAIYVEYRYGSTGLNDILLKQTYDFLD